MNNKEKERIEKCVVQIECVNKVNKNDIELGTGFFVDKNIVITASHVINKYYENSSQYDINIIPVKANLDKVIKVKKTVESERNNYISILELEETVETISPLKFTLGYAIKRDDMYFTFGHPRCKRIVGYPVENRIATSINERQSYKINWDLNLSGERLEDFEGFSGSPVVINNMLIGIVQTESNANGKTISIGMTSIDIIRAFVLDKYCQEYDDIACIQQFTGNGIYKFHTIDDIDQKLQDSTEPAINLGFFEIDDDEFKKSFKDRLNKNIYVVGKSREETLYCILNELKYTLNYSKVLIVDNKESWEYLNDKISSAILIPNFYIGEIVAIKNNINVFIYGEDEHCTKPDKIILKRRTRKTIIEKLEKIGMDNNEAYDCVEKTNGLFIPIKRKLFKGQYNIDPVWCREQSNSFVVALLCGKWTECQGDKNIIQELSGKSYDEFMRDLLPFMKGGEPFVIGLVHFGTSVYQLANSEIAWEYLEERIDKTIWDKFIKLSFEVITKLDPIFEKPFEEHYRASFNTEKPENSNLLKYGMIRSMTFRGIYRKTECQYHIDKTVGDILRTINSVQRWGYISQFFTELCEASPKALIERLEHELNSPSGLLELFEAGSNNTFTGRHYYTNILWAIEQLLLYKEYVVRAVQWLFAIDAKNLKYSMTNSPKSTLQDVFCSWFNISVLTTTDKITLAQYAVGKYENGWELIFNELPGQHQTIFGSGNSPHYREVDEKEILTHKAVATIYKAYAQLCINNIKGDLEKWIKIINVFSIFPNEMIDDLLNKLGSELNEMDDPNKGIIKDKLRSEIYRHRYFSTAGWSMDAETLEKIEKVCMSINFTIKEYDYIYLFKGKFDMPILHPIPYNNGKENENEILKNKEIEEGIKRFRRNKLDLVFLIKLIDKEGYTNLGVYIAKYYTDGNFDNAIYGKLLNIKDIESVILSYVNYIYRNGDNSVIEKAKLLSKKYNGKDDLYVAILSIEDLNYDNHPAIMDEDESIKQLYWSQRMGRFQISNDKNTLKWVLHEFKKYNNYVSYIDCLYGSLKIHTSEEVLQYMIDLKKFEGIQLNDQMADYYLKEIMKSIETKFEIGSEKDSEIASLEMFMFNIMEWREMKRLQKAFKTNPYEYAQIIDIVYLHEGEDRSKKTKEKDTIIQNYYNFYQKALFCPCEDNGNIDLEELKTWVEMFRNQLIKQCQLNLLGHSLGRLFAYSPIGKDGHYPHESVRLIIEELSDDDLRKSYIIEECNKRGVYTPNAGIEEKEKALQYKEKAEGIRILYPESAKIYDELYKCYQQKSEVERRAAEDGYR
jgi:V8-like Glu-specific endopeptidase